MQVTGKLLSVNRDWQTNKLNITFQINEEPKEEINYLNTCEMLSIEAKKYRQKRSLDSNAYAWKLMQELAEKTHTDRETIYIQMLQRYSREFAFVICKEKAISKLKDLYRTCIDLGEVEVNGATGHQMQVFFGSSTFDTKAMSVFIDGIVSECKELGIETMTPDDIERMKSQWRSQS